MQYRTEINILDLFPKINPREKITLMGSCFSDNIGKKLLNSKFSVAANPLGTIFNPVSISKIILKYLLYGKEINPEELCIENGIVSHPDFHSSHNTLTIGSYIRELEAKLKATSNHLKNSNTLILTLGTAFAYHDINNDLIVSNCHKRGAHNFKKQLLSIQEIVTNLSECIEKLNMRTILTVSPIRHIKDGMVENNRSKARLIESCHIITESMDNCHYFPAYEIMMDDLRDYRYYTRDLIHPTDLAVDYIWDLFIQFAMDTEAINFISKNEQLAAAYNHRPMLPESDDFKKFCSNQLKKTKALQEEYPFADYSNEINHFNQFLL